MQLDAERDDGLNPARGIALGCLSVLAIYAVGAALALAVAWGLGWIG